jgi:uncharacterized protein YeaO (DUF488 family)
MIQIKRTYDGVSRDDGRRILVERLWPRGMTKAAVAAEAWMKDVAPSTALRTWFGHREERWEEFRKRYEQELDAHPAAWQPLLEAGKHGTLTLLYSAHDPLHNGALVLRDYLLRRQNRRSKSSRRSSSPDLSTAASAGSRRRPSKPAR